ncbi:diguanylate cyclase [Shewanella eurypsychrophilus]|uniref:Diguanylate cyclase n=1 Tax=Shewanella eurypsychrophilus TaxID=2593656 RepID=A0ABX6V1V6_9GAMM|nr:MULTISPECIES: diguanylate cyclase [Shewanella]QFU21313.1 diguanylate cyclase [Shewanella sp. YLB-09]QPG56604.1 diguanylate cyclase [Shewanella eurypsychrophilus]
MKRFRHKLYFKVAAAIALSAAIVAVLSSYFFYFDELARNEQDSREHVHQLSRTVEKTASIAVYVQDSVLASEIIDGLAINDLVSEVELISEPGFSVFSGEGSLVGKEGVSTLLLYHPFSESEVIGELKILPNEAFIARNAKDAAVNQAQMLALLTVVTAILVSFIVHKTLTSPLNRITNKFEEIKPGETCHITVPRFHQQDEIGSLVKGINALVSSLNQSIDSERNLREKTEILEKKFRLIFEQASAGICLIDSENLLVTANPAFHRIIFKSHSIADAIGLCLTDWFYNKQQLESFLTDIRQSHHLDTVALDLKMKTLAGSPDCWVHCLFSKVLDGESQSSLMIEVLMYDVTERTEREINTRFEADHDGLTHLKNRRAGRRSLMDLFERAKANSKIAVIMNIDLDNFKTINDDYGHEMGDLVLIEVGRRMMSVFRNDDLCVRWGGDEFIVGCYFDSSHFETRSLPAIEKLAAELREALNKQIKLNGELSIKIGGSIGIAIYPQHGDDLESVLSAADSAMYKSKQEGRNQYSIFNSELTDGSSTCSKSHPKA